MSAEVTNGHFERDLNELKFRDAAASVSQRRALRHVDGDELAQKRCSRQRRASTARPQQLMAADLRRWLPLRHLALVIRQSSQNRRFCHSRVSSAWIFPHGSTLRKWPATVRAATIELARSVLSAMIWYCAIRFSANPYRLSSSHRTIDCFPLTNIAEDVIYILRENPAASTVAPASRSSLQRRERPL